MKAYVFIIKSFFVENGTDYAGAIDDDSIRVFNHLNDACAHREKVFTDFVNRCKDSIVKDFFCDRYWRVDLSNGSRVIFQIMDKNLEKTEIKY